MWEHLDKIIAAASGSLGTGAGAAIYALIRSRRSRKQKLSLEEAVRKELWDEIAALRAALREASATLMEWQTKNLTLVNEVIQSQKRIAKLAGLVNEAMTCLDRIEDVERHVTGNNPDLLKAKQEIDAMKVEAQVLKVNAAAILRA